MSWPTGQKDSSGNGSAGLIGLPNTADGPAAVEAGFSYSSLGSAVRTSSPPDFARRLSGLRARPQGKVTPVSFPWCP